MFSITSNVSNLVRTMKRRKDAVTGKLTEAAREIAPELNREAKSIMQAEIYDMEIPLKATADHGLEKVPESLRQSMLERRQFDDEARQIGGVFDKPLSEKSKIRGKTTKGKYGKWQRTGALKRAETVTVDGIVIILRNNQLYAAARNALGTAESSRKIKSPGVKSVQWQQQAIESKRTFILEVRRKKVLEALQIG